MAALLNAGADRDAINSAGDSPLFRAVDRNQGSTVQILLEAGATTNTREGLKDQTLLHRAVLSYDDDSDDDEDGRETLVALLGAGADRNALDADGYAPLSLAIIERHERVVIVETLLEGGADADLPAKRTALPLSTMPSGTPLEHQRG